jgi:hypothetical protein
MDSKYMIFPTMGVLTKIGDPEFGVPIQKAYVVGDTLTTVNDDGSETPYAAENVSEEGKTGRIIFRADNADYRIRELREDDGYWMSKYKTLLPVGALQLLINQKSKDTDMDTSEILSAYANDNSVYVIGLVYENDLGRWLRIDGDWSLMDEEDKTFMDSIAIEIDPERADDYIELYDKNYVTVTDTEDYEIASEETE